jgi:protein-tyrosine phosphatase
VRLKDSAFDDLQTDFWEGVKFVKESIDGGGIVLIHCKQGVSRSPALGIAYLMENRGYTFDDALALLKAKRPQIEIDPEFERQLRSRSA